MTTLWNYRARPTRVVDGDTFELLVDVGFQAQVNIWTRLARVDAPEKRGHEREAGMAATRYVERWFAGLGETPWPIVIHTEKDDSFGRWIAEIMPSDADREDQRTLSDAMVEDGYAIYKEY